jgi:WD40 repeat protein
MKAPWQVRIVLGFLRLLVVLGAVQAAPQSTMSAPDLQLGHAGSITGAVFSPGGQLLATGGDDHTIKIWDAKERRVISTLSGSTDKITALVFSKDGRTLLSADGGIIRSWSAEKDWEMTVFSRSEESISSLAYSIDEKQVLAGSLDGTIRFRNAQSGAEENILRDKGAVKFVSLDPNHPEMLVVGTWDIGGEGHNAVHLWNIPNSQIVYAISLESVPENVIITPDSHAIITLTTEHCSFWSFTDGKLIRTLDQSVSAVAIQSVDHILTYDGITVTSWNMATGYKEDSQRLLGISNVFVINPAHTLAFLGNSFLDLKTKQSLPLVTQDVDKLIAFDVYKSDRIAASVDNKVTIWDLHKSTMYVLKDEKRDFLAKAGAEAALLRFSPNGHYLLSLAFSGGFELWDLEQGKVLWFKSDSSSQVNDVAFSPDGDTIAEASEDGNVRLWNTRNGSPQRTIKGFPAPAAYVAFTPDGSRVVSAGWEQVSHENGIQIPDFSDVASTKSWTIKTGKQVTSFISEGLNSLSGKLQVTPDGKSLFSIREGITKQDIVSGRTMAHFGEDLGFWVTVNVSYSRDLSRIAATDQNGSVTVWDAERGVKLLSFPANAKSIQGGLAYNASGKWIASLTNQGTLDIWDAFTGQKLATLVSYNSGTDWLAFSGRNFIGSPLGETQVPLQVAPTSISQTGLRRDATALNSLEWEKSVKDPTERNGANEGLLQPQVALILPEGVNNTTFKQTSLRLRIHLTFGNQLDDLKEVGLLQDGRITRVWARDLPTDRDKTLDLYETVSVRVGTNVFSAYAISLRGSKSVSKELEVAAKEVLPDAFIQSGHSGNVYDTKFSPVENLIASAGVDKNVVLWDATTGQELRELSGHTGLINALAFSNDGKLLASASEDHTAILWEVATGKHLRTLAAHSEALACLAFSPDGKIVATGSDDHTISLWDVNTGIEIRTLVGHLLPVSKLAFSPDGKWLASASFDRTIRLWNLSGSGSPRVLQQHGVVSGLVFTKDGNSLIAGEQLGSLVFWNLATGQVSRSVMRATKEDPSIPDAQTPFLLDDLTWSPGNKYLVASDGLMYASDLHGWMGVTDRAGSLRFFDPTTGAETFRLSGASGNGLKGVTFNKDNTLVASGLSDGSVQIWNLQLRKMQRVLGGSASTVSSIDLSPDGQKLAMAGDGVYLWNLQSGSCERSLGSADQSYNRAIFTTDAYHVATQDADLSVALWDISAGAKKRTLVHGKDSVAWNLGNDYSSLAFSGKSQRLLAAYDRGENPTVHGPFDVRVWDLKAPQAHLLSELGKETNESPGLAEFDKSGDRVVSANTSGVTIWDVTTGSEVRRIVASSTATAAALSQDGKVAVASVKEITMWDASSGSQIPISFLDSANASTLTFSVDGLYLAGTVGEAVKIWSVQRGEITATLAGSSSTITRTLFLPNKAPAHRTLLSVSEKGEVSLWDAENGELLARLFSFGSADWVVLTPNGLFDGSPGGWQKVLWRFGGSVRDVSPVESFFSDYYRPQLLNALISGRRPQPADVPISRKDRRRPVVAMSLLKGSVEAGTSKTATIVVNVAEASPGLDKTTNKNYPNGSGVRDVRLFRNGTLAKIWHGEQSLSKNGSVTLTTEIELREGVNNISAYAFNRDNVKSDDATLAVTSHPPSSNPSVLYVLAVGVDEYSIGQLRYAVNDAESFARTLAAEQLRLKHYDRVESIILTNQNASKTNLLWALQRLGGASSPVPTNAPTSLGNLAPARPADGVVVFFAGHGFTLGQTYYVAPYGLKSLETAEVSDHGLSDMELDQAFESIGADSMVMIIDACDSGQSLENNGQGPENSVGLGQLAYEKGMYILTASQADRPAKEAPQYQHGFLTFALVEEGLKQFRADDAPEDGKVMLREWFDYAANEVPQLGSDAQGVRRVTITDSDERNDSREESQHPKVFYRREMSADEFIVAERLRPVASLQ